MGYEIESTFLNICSTMTMKRRNLQPVKTDNLHHLQDYLFTIFLVLIGATISIVLLHFNQQLSGTLSIASMISPTGARVEVSGARIKHWMVGILLCITSIIFYVSKLDIPHIKYLSTIAFASGFTLFADELDELL